MPLKVSSGNACTIQVRLAVKSEEVAVLTIMSTGRWRCYRMRALANPPIIYSIWRPALMRFFLDTANLEELKTGAHWGIVDGVTTNPTLIAREGVPIEQQIARICEIVDGDISAEVVATDADGMLTEGRKLARIHKNVVVKVPLTRDGIRACSVLSREGTRVNVTLCF